MKLLIDCADIEMIKKIYDCYPMDGVTCNPTILAKTGKPPYETLKEIRSFIGDEAELHVQAVSRDCDGIISEAKRIVAELGANTYVKVPANEQGLKAMKMLKQQNINVTATAIYTQMQAYLAAKAGADYAAPYVNRIDNLGANGVETAMSIHDIYENNGFETKVLAASFKNTQQVLELCKYGVGAATVSPEVIAALLKNQIVDDAIEAFIDDFESLCGEGKTMLDCE